MEGEAKPSQDENNETALAAPKVCQREAKNQCCHRESKKNTLKDPMFYLLLGTLGATGLAGWFTWDQASIARADQRAWIGPPEIKPIRSEAGNKWDFEFVFKNVGRTPSAGLFINGSLGKTVSVSKLCSEAKEALAKEPGYNLSSVPQAEFRIRASETNALTGLHDVDTTTKDNWIFGCVAYRVRSDYYIHKTGFAARFVNSAGSLSVTETYAVNPD